MGIDWSKAPEGATHYCIGGDSETAWRDLSGAGAKYWSEGKWHDHHGISSEFCLKHGVFEVRPIRNGWNGEGLPPVGTVCEVRAEHIREGDWTEVKVLALGLHDKDVAVLVAEHADGIVDEMHCLLYTGFEDNFRPIKTKEQLAEKEREKAVESMVDDILRNTTGIDHKEAWCCSTALYDAGYRRSSHEH